VARAADGMTEDLSCKDEYDLFLAFDDTAEHSAWNNSDTDRVIVLSDDASGSEVPGTQALAGREGQE
jgi:hypothetical protein